jgi:hypothetical protein
MLKRDYIQRLIEEYAHTIAKAMGLKSQERNSEALELVRRGYHDYLQLDADVIDELDASQLIEIMQQREVFTYGQLEIVASALKTEGELLLETDSVTSRNKLQTALDLLLWIEQHDTANFSFHRKSLVSSVQSALSA